jgi:hypothetical protein
MRLRRLTERQVTKVLAEHNLAPTGRSTNFVDTLAALVTFDVLRGLMAYKADSHWKGRSYRKGGRLVRDLREEAEVEADNEEGNMKAKKPKYESDHAGGRRVQDALADAILETATTERPVRYLTIIHDIDGSDAAETEPAKTARSFTLPSNGTQPAASPRMSGLATTGA